MHTPTHANRKRRESQTAELQRHDGEILPAWALPLRCPEFSYSALLRVSVCECGGAWACVSVHECACIQMWVSESNRHGAKGQRSVDSVRTPQDQRTRMCDKYSQQLLPLPLLRMPLRPLNFCHGKASSSSSPLIRWGKRACRGTSGDLGYRIFYVSIAQSEVSCASFLSFSFVFHHSVCICERGKSAQTTSGWRGNPGNLEVLNMVARNIFTEDFPRFFSHLKN